MVPATQRYQMLLNEGLFSDITFIVGSSEEEIKAHKGILSISSPVFYYMFSGNFIEGKKEDTIHQISIVDIEPEAFKSFLQFIYTDEVIINKKNWAPILYASEKYDIPILKEKCTEFVINCCNFDNACEFYIQGQTHHVLDLVPLVRGIFGDFARDSLASDAFLNMNSKESLKEVLSFDKLNCDEILVFRAALRWASAQLIKNGEDEVCGTKLREMLGPALYAIRFQRISPNVLTKQVIPTDILSDEEIICILKRKDSSPFNSHARIRGCKRFSDTNCGTIRTIRHSVKFKVDHSVRIHGYDIFGRVDFEDSLHGRMFLREDERMGLLGEKFFDVNREEKNLNDVFVNFAESITVLSNTWYVAVIELNTINVTTWIGNDGHSSVVIDGVKWMFKNESSSKETNVKRGLLHGPSRIQVTAGSGSSRSHEYEAPVLSDGY